VALIGHDAGHLGVFRSARANWARPDLLELCTGIGFWYWYHRHNAHHGHTNDAARSELQGQRVGGLHEQDAASAPAGGAGVAAPGPSPLHHRLPAVHSSFAFRVESYAFAWKRLRGGRAPLDWPCWPLNLRCGPSSAALRLALRRRLRWWPSRGRLLLPRSSPQP